jgi:pimeloyl-ACP methyl ester carboxylesterase
MYLVVAALLWTTLVYVPRQVVYPAPLPLTGNPAELGMVCEDVELTATDRPLKLAGWWMPAAKPRATLVFIHGGTSNRNSRFFGALEFYQAMVDNNVSVFAIDLRNHGESDDDPRGVQFGKTEQLDARAAIEWTRGKAPQLPLYAMGISMGGATLIYASAAGAPIDGLILMDPLLDTHSAFTQAIHAQTGWPAWPFLPSAWAATTFYGLPSGDEQALAVAKGLQLRTLLIQDPDDPVTRAVYAREVASSNPHIDLWEAPAIAPDHPEVAWRNNWGSHVAGFLVHREALLERLLSFIESSHREV